MSFKAIHQFGVDIFSFPSFGSALSRVWLRNYLYFRYTIWISVLWVFAEPLLYLFAIGYGLGQLVGEIQGRPYVEFFFPALMVSSSMMVAYFEGTYGTYTKLTRQKTFNTILLTPITSSEIVMGELLWVATKGFLSGLAVFLVASALGLIRIDIVLPLLALLVLVSLMFAGFGITMASFARNYDWFVYSQTGFIMPMYLFSGTYFPLESLPMGLQYVAWTLPLTHAVMASRDLLWGTWTSVTFLNIGFLFVFAVLLMNLSVARLQRKMIV